MMAKPGTQDMSAAPDTRSTHPLQPEGARDAYMKMMGQIDEMNRTAMSSLQQMTEASWELAEKLSHCDDPAEAMRRCSDWWTRRREAMLSDGRRMSDLMLKAYKADMDLAEGAMQRLVSTMPAQPNLFSVSAAE
jgi:hypothetical protein